MSSKSYYGDLSGASSDDGDSSSDEEQEDLDGRFVKGRRDGNVFAASNPDDQYSNIWDRSIIPLDIDCL